MTDDEERAAFVSLRDYFDFRLVELDKRIMGSIADRDARIQIALTAAKEAVDKAEAANERRLGLLNEFRGQQADEARKYAERTVVATQFSAVEERMIRTENGLTALMAQTQNASDLDKRVNRLERSDARLAGLVATAVLLSSAITALVVRALGG